MMRETLKTLNKNDLINEVLTLHEEVEYWQSMAKQFQNQAFGKKSEKYKNIDEVTQPLFEFMDENKDSSEAENDELFDDSENENSKDSNPKKKKRNRKPKNYDHLPQKEEIIPVAEVDRYCDCCGKERTLLRYETKRILHFIPGTYEVIHQKREVLACCSQSLTPIITAEIPIRLLPFVSVSDELIVWIIVSKVIDRQTLYHMEQQLAKRYECPLSRQSMARWMILAADPLQIMVDLIKKHIKKYDVMWVDATRFQVLKEETKKPETDSYCYCAKGGPPGQMAVLFEYSENHHSFLKPFLSDWQGYVHADALNAYNFLRDIEGIEMVLCNVHARRKFKVIVDTCKKNKSGVANSILKLYRAIYKIEREIKDAESTPEQRAKIREEKTKPLMAQIKKIIDTKFPVTGKAVRLYKALEYSLDHWKELNTFFKDGRLELDNNYCEQMIKYFALARNNFLFADSVAGAKALALHFTLLHTAQLNGLDPMKYYTYLFKQIPHCNPDNIEEFEKLLPWNLNKADL